MVAILLLVLVLWLIGIEPAHAQYFGGVSENVLRGGVGSGLLSGGVSENVLRGGVGSGLLSGGVGALGGLLSGGSGLLSSLFGGGASFGPVNQTTDYVPTVNQNPNQSGVQNVNIDFSQIGGPGGNASAQSAGGGLFSFGGAKATGGAGGSNIANFDPTINQVYVPDTAYPLMGFMQSLGQGNEPFPALMDMPTATPSTFRPPVPTNMPIQGGIGMNVPANVPTPGLAALAGGNLAPNSAAAPLMGQQASPVSQGSPLSQMMPPIAPQGAINTAQAMPPMAPSLGGSAMMPPLAPNVTQAAQTFPINPVVALGMDEEAPQGLSATAKSLSEPLQTGVDTSPTFANEGAGAAGILDELARATPDKVDKVIDKLTQNLNNALKKSPKAVAKEKSQEQEVKDETDELKKALKKAKKLEVKNPAARAADLASQTVEAEKQLLHPHRGLGERLGKALQYGIANMAMPGAALQMAQMRGLENRTLAQDYAKVFNASLKESSADTRAAVREEREAANQLLGHAITEQQNQIKNQDDMSKLLTNQAKVMADENLKGIRDVNSVSAQNAANETRQMNIALRKVQEQISQQKANAYSQWVSAYTKAVNNKIANGGGKVDPKITELSKLLGTFANLSYLRSQIPKGKTGNLDHLLGGLYQKINDSNLLPEITSAEPEEEETPEGE